MRFCRVAQFLLLLLAWSSQWISTAALVGEVCEGNKFKLDNECKTCDDNCVPGRCADGVGCKECKDNFHVTVSAENVRVCSPCTINNCNSCVDTREPSEAEKCAECKHGFVPRENGSLCVEQTEHNSDCGNGYYRKQGRCRLCDRDCSEGHCIDVVGCSKCNEGYHGYREDVYWPFMCIPCAISVPGCAVCERRDHLGKDPLCNKCEEGFELSEDGKTCEEADRRVRRRTRRSNDDMRSTRRTFFMTDASTRKTDFILEPPKVTVSRKRYEDSPPEEGSPPPECPPHHFRKDEKQCMRCDQNCGEGKCGDYTGCTECAPGYYTTREDPYWPFECARCKDKIPNCAKCQDGVMTIFPVPCEQCEHGYRWSLNGFACLKEDSP
ncbi:hypothetical protein BSKO_01832 [Bryopsis sp. KO-2023]|nr:hypothetical protein BSKO_01832 [Bryopsis sp. KO-2023]